MVWPDRFEERLHIIAHGEKFDVDTFLARSALRPDFVWRRSAPLTSGVEFLLGDGRAIRLPDQVLIATKYLDAHREELQSLPRFSGVDVVILGLVHIVKRKDDRTGSALMWYPELMARALDLGITPVYYVTIDQRSL